MNVTRALCCPRNSPHNGPLKATRWYLARGACGDRPRRSVHRTKRKTERRLRRQDRYFFLWTLATQLTLHVKYSRPGFLVRSGCSNCS